MTRTFLWSVCTLFALGCATSGVDVDPVDDGKELGLNPNGEPNDLEPDPGAQQDDPPAQTEEPPVEDPPNLCVPGFQVGQCPDDFQLPDGAGNAISLSSLRGYRVAVIGSAEY